MTLIDHLINFCIATTFVLSVVFALLVARRWFTELRAPALLSRRSAITRSYLQRVGGFQQDNRFAAWSVHERMRSVEHLLLLLRGGDRDRLIQLAEIDGLLARAIGQTRSRRAARRIDAIRILQQFGGEAAIAKLREVLGHDRHRTVRLNAAFALASFGRLPPPRETIALLRMPERTPSRLDVAILRAMAPDYFDHLERMLDDEISPERRASLIDALGWSSQASVLPTLKNASLSDDKEVRCAALRAAAKLGHPSAAPWVMLALKDANTNVRIQAANSCASLALLESIPALQAATNDSDLWVRLRAFDALAKLSPADFRSEQSA